MSAGPIRQFYPLVKSGEFDTLCKECLIGSRETAGGWAPTGPTTHFVVSNAPNFLLRLKACSLPSLDGAASSSFSRANTKRHRFRINNLTMPHLFHSSTSRRRGEKNPTRNEAFFCKPNFASLAPRCSSLRYSPSLSQYPHGFSLCQALFLISFLPYFPQRTAAR